MAEIATGLSVPERRERARTRWRRATQRVPGLVRALLIGLAVAFLGLFVLVPLANVCAQALAKGFPKYLTTLQGPNMVSAITLTLTVALICVPLNTLFGLAAAWAIGKFAFRGQALLVTLIDLPFAVSPVIAGLIFILIFGAQGYLGPWLKAHDVQIIFALPGIVLATLFVTCPFVARTLVPAMEATGREYEEAAIASGANAWQMFWHVTLPSVKWGLLYGVILCNARAMGEFGAVAVVSGKITGHTDTLPLRIEKLYVSFDSQAAFTVASLLAGLALVTLVVKTIVERRSQGTGERE